MWNGDASTIDAVSVGLRQMGGGIMSHIYLFDLLGDCECPTFSKQGTFLKKGFFVMAGIGAVNSEKKIDNSFTDGNLDFTARFGIGVDIGVTDLITVTPFIQTQYFPSVSWHEVGTAFLSDPPHIESSLHQIQFGVRLGFRPDYK